MKSDKKKLFASLVKGIFRGKRKQSAATERYLECIPYIQKLIDTHKLGINLKERIVVMDVSVHACFAKYYPGGSDKKHAAFFDKIVAYMNYQLGRMGIKDFIDPVNDTIHFQVTTENISYISEDGTPLPAHEQVSFKTILVGWYKNGELDYKELKDGQM